MVNSSDTEVFICDTVVNRYRMCKGEGPGQWEYNEVHDIDNTTFYIVDP